MSALREFEVCFVSLTPSDRRLTIHLAVNSAGRRVRPVEAVVRCNELESSGRSAVEGALLHALCADAARRAELLIRCSAESLDEPMTVRPWVRAALDEEARFSDRPPIGPGSVVRRFVAVKTR